MIERIEGIYDRLTKAEKKIADYILERPEDVIHYSISEFAKIVGVGEATVHRLVKKIGFEGFQKFKIELAKEVSRMEITFVEDPLDELVSELDYMVKSVRSLVKREELCKAVDFIVNANKIVFFGVGLSGVTANYGSVKFSMLNIPSFYYNDPHLQVIVGVNLTPKDVVVAISHTGNIRDTVKSTSVAKDVGAKTIVITSGINSPLSELGDVVLYTKSPFKKDIYYFMRGNIGELVMVEILFRMTLSRIASEKKEDFSKMSDVLRPKRF